MSMPKMTGVAEPQAAGSVGRPRLLRAQAMLGDALEGVFIRGIPRIEMFTQGKPLRPDATTSTLDVAIEGKAGVPYGGKLFGL